MARIQRTKITHPDVPDQWMNVICFINEDGCHYAVEINGKDVDWGKEDFEKMWKFPFSPLYHQPKVLGEFLEAAGHNAPKLSTSNWVDVIHKFQFFTEEFFIEDFFNKADEIKKKEIDGNE